MRLSFAASGAVGLLGGAGVRTVADSAVVQQRDQLRSEVEALRSRLESLQAANSTAMSSKTELIKQLADAQATIINKEQELNKSSQQQAALQAQQAATAATWLTTQTKQEGAAQAAEVTRQQMNDLQQELKAKDAQVRKQTSSSAQCIDSNRQVTFHTTSDVARLLHCIRAFHNGLMVNEHPVDQLSAL